MISFAIPRHEVILLMDAIDQLGNEAPLHLKMLWGRLEASLEADPEPGGEMVHAPETISHGGLVLLMEDLLEGIRSGDSLEGHVGWLLPESDDAPPQSFDVLAGWRVGNLQGQGGFRMIGRWERRRSEDRDSQP